MSAGEDGAYDEGSMGEHVRPKGGRVENFPEGPRQTLACSVWDANGSLATGDEEVSTDTVVNQSNTSKAVERTTIKPYGSICSVLYHELVSILEGRASFDQEVGEL